MGEIVWTVAAFGVGVAVGMAICATSRVGRLSDARSNQQQEETMEDLLELFNVGKTMSEHRGGGKAGYVYVRPDPQDRLGDETWAVVIQGDAEGPYSDTTQLGLFWQERQARLYRDAVIRALPDGHPQKARLSDAPSGEGERDG